MTEEAGTSVLQAIQNERSELQVLVARALKDLGLPEQRFDIQASFLTFSPLDLAIRLVWPISMEFQGRPTGVIQIGTRARRWNPETRVIIVNARLMSGRRLQREIREWCRSMTAQAREAVERRQGKWPNGWPRLQQRGAVTVDAMPTRSTGVSRAGRVRK